jgi:hypothetical protein
MEDALKPRLAPQNALLLVVDIKNIHLTRIRGKPVGPHAQQPAQDWSAKWVEEKSDAGTRR